MNHSFNRRGFSLAELLVVIAVISVLIALLAGGSRSLVASRAINNSGALLTNLALQAQQTATAKNVMTMLVIAPEPEGRLRLVTLLETSLGASTWTQTSRWDRFSDGIFLEPGPNDFPDPPIKHTPFPMTHTGRTIKQNDARFLVFLPGGGLLGGGNVSCRLSALSDPNHDNPYTIHVNAATGACTIERP